MLRQLVLEGSLAQFGGPFTFDVASVQEAVHALTSQIKGTYRAIRQGEFLVFADDVQRQFPIVCNADNWGKEDKICCSAWYRNSGRLSGTWSCYMPYLDASWYIRADNTNTDNRLSSGIRRHNACDAWKQKNLISIPSARRRYFCNMSSIFRIHFIISDFLSLCKGLDLIFTGLNLVDL